MEVYFNIGWEDAMSQRLIGCCGAYCKTCKVYREALCKGCKVGYDTEERDISRAKCAMKVCCIKRGLDELRGLRGL